MRSHLITVRISINIICVIEQKLIRIGKKKLRFSTSVEKFNIIY